MDWSPGPTSLNIALGHGVEHSSALRFAFPHHFKHHVQRGLEHSSSLMFPSPVGFNMKCNIVPDIVLDEPGFILMYAPLGTHIEASDQNN